MVSLRLDWTAFHFISLFSVPHTRPLTLCNFPWQFSCLTEVYRVRTRYPARYPHLASCRAACNRCLRQSTYVIVCVRLKQLVRFNSSIITFFLISLNLYIIHTVRTLFHTKKCPYKTKAEPRRKCIFSWIY